MKVFVSRDRVLALITKVCIIKSAFASRCNKVSPDKRLLIICRHQLYILYGFLVIKGNVWFPLWSHPAKWMCCTEKQSRVHQSNWSFCQMREMRYLLTRRDCLSAETTAHPSLLCLDFYASQQISYLQTNLQNLAVYFARQSMWFRF